MMMMMMMKTTTTTTTMMMMMMMMVNPYPSEMTKLEKLAQLFQVSIHVHPCHSLQQTTRNSFNA